MINYLLELGIEDNDIKNIVDFNKDLMDFEEYKKNIELLKIIGCDDEEIKNIVISNPNVLVRSNTDLLKLINEFRKYGFTSLNIYFDSNPYLLDKDDFELVNYFEEKKKQGLTNDDIIDLIELNMYDFE